MVYSVQWSRDLYDMIVYSVQTFRVSKIPALSLEASTTTDRSRAVLHGDAREAENAWQDEVLMKANTAATAVTLLNQCVVHRFC